MSIAGARTQAHHQYQYRGVTTVIRQAIETHSEANAKLGNIKYADEVGDAPYFVPEPQFGAVRPSHQRIGRTGSSSAFGQKRCAPHAETSLSLVGSLARAHVSRAEATPRTIERREPSFLSARGPRARVRRARPGIGRPLATPAANEP